MVGASPIVIVMFAIGVYPRWLLKPMEPSVLNVVQRVRETNLSVRHEMVGGANFSFAANAAPTDNYMGGEQRWRR